MASRRSAAIVLAALGCAVAATALILSSDHLDGKVVWAVLGPTVGVSFVATGLYAQRRHPESRVGTLMVWFGFAWFASVVGASDWAFLYTFGLLTGGLWGGVFLQLVMSFPTGSAAPTPRPAQACAGSPTAWLRSTARCGSTARRARERACTPRSRADDDSPAPAPPT